MGLSKNFDCCCVEKFLWRWGFGFLFCLLEGGDFDDDEDENDESDICVGGDLGLKCSLKIRNIYE